MLCSRTGEKPDKSHKFQPLQLSVFGLHLNTRVRWKQTPGKEGEKEMKRDVIGRKSRGL